MLMSSILLYSSLLLNFILLILIVIHESMYHRLYITFLRPRYDCFGEKRRDAKDVDHLDKLFIEKIRDFKPLSSSEGRLTHVVMPYHPRQERMVFDNLSSWSNHLPCYPVDPNANFDIGKDIELVLFPACAPDKSMETRLRIFYDSLPKEVTKCFQRMTIRFADLGPWNDNYLSGTRLMFEQLFEIPHSHYIFYMEPDVRPVRNYWLQHIDAHTRGEPFWVKGSIFRGDLAQAFHSSFYLPNLIHISGNAIYNASSPELRSFYHEIVRPFIVNYRNTGAYDTDFTIALLEVSLWPVMREYVGMFKLDDFLANWWHSDWCKEDVIASSEDTVLVHGGKDICAK